MDWEARGACVRAWPAAAPDTRMRLIPGQAVRPVTEAHERQLQLQGTRGGRGEETFFLVLRPRDTENCNCQSPYEQTFLRSLV